MLLLISKWKWVLWEPDDPTVSEQETSQTVDKCSYSGCSFSKDSDNFINVVTWRLLLFGSLPCWEKAQDITKSNITFSAVT